MQATDLNRSLCVCMANGTDWEEFVLLCRTLTTGTDTVPLPPSKSKNLQLKPTFSEEKNPNPGCFKLE
nr:hypothetical protein CFP56_29568 [Quercus suber]